MSANAVPLIDCHAHLQDRAFSADREGMLRRAAEAGVNVLVCNGTEEADWPLVAELARNYPQVIPCFGLHPWRVGSRSAEWLQALTGFLDNTRSGVGEIGLDRWLENRDEPAQEKVFRQQFQAAKKRGLPVMIHCLRAWDWLMAVLREECPLPSGMLLHAYGGPVELVQPLADMGAYFSFAGNVLEERRVRAREAMKQVPSHRLLLETDAPDMLPPEPYRQYCLVGAGGRKHNEPANLAGIMRGAAALLGRSEPELRKLVWNNAREFLNGLA